MDGNQEILIEPDKKTIHEKVEPIKRDVTMSIKKRMSWIVVIGASLLYIFKETLDLGRTTKTIDEIIMGMALTYIFTIYISIALRNLGKKSGKDSTQFKRTLKYLGDAKESVKPIIYLTPAFCRYKNTTSLEDVKRILLEEQGLSYTIYKKGKYKEEKIQKILTDEQKKFLNGLQSLKITTIAPSDLLSEHSKSNHKNPLYLGKSEQQDAKQSGITMIFTKLLTPIVLGYFAVDFMMSSNIWWGAIQVGIILLIGITHYMNGEEFVLTELRNRFIGKADLLTEFKNLHENNPKIFEDDTKLIEELLKEDEAEPKKDDTKEPE